MTRILMLLVLGLWLSTPENLRAQNSREWILPMNGQVSADGTKIELTWYDAKPSRVGSVTVNRRLFRESGPQSWTSITPTAAPIIGFSDPAVVPGVAYEYQVLRSGHDLVDLGYWVAGIEVTAPESRGTAHLVVEESVAEGLALHLARFVRDLTGDGWTVNRYSAPRHNKADALQNLRAANTIKQTLRRQYNSDPFGQHAIILVGHVPIVRSGSANPDGHSPIPHATDLFYAEIDGQWQANPEGLLLHNQVPSSFIEMQIGRIDFATIAGAADEELRALQAYFDKNHHWRMQFHGDLREAYGNSGTLPVERNALRNIVGPEAVTRGGHYDVGEEKAWLVGVDFGAYDAGKTHQNKAIFTIDFGSGKQHFNHSGNPMTGLLAQPWYPLATGWGGRPAWWLHRMALGASIGDVHFRTVNNGIAEQPYRDTMDYFPTGNYLFRNPVWVNLLGDPTARPFPLAPPKRLVARHNDGTVSLDWTPSSDPDVIGYKIYRAAAGADRFTPLTSVIESTQFTDTAAPEGARYMVRAYGLKTVHAGSFYTFSQGAFTDEIALLENDINTNMKIVTAPGQPVTLPAAFRPDSENIIHAPIRAPEQGSLEYDGDQMNWVYTPPMDFTGVVTLEYSVSTAWQTERGTLSVHVGG